MENKIVLNKGMKVVQLIFLNKQVEKEDVMGVCYIPYSFYGKHKEIIGELKVKVSAEGRKGKEKYNKVKVKEFTLEEAVYEEFVDRTYNFWHIISNQLRRITGEPTHELSYVLNGVIGEEQTRLEEKIYGQLSKKEDRDIISGSYDKLSELLEYGERLDLGVKEELVYNTGKKVTNEKYLTGVDNDTEDLKLEDKVLVVSIKGLIEGENVGTGRESYVGNSLVLPLDKVKSKIDDLEGIEISLEDVGIKGTIEGKKTVLVEVKEVKVKDFNGKHKRDLPTNIIKDSEVKIFWGLIKEVSKILEVEKDIIKETRDRYSKVLVGEQDRVLGIQFNQNDPELALSIEVLPELPDYEDIKWEGVEDLWVK